MTIKLRIDGKAVQGQTGQTLLSAAREAGVYIPSLCGHPDLPPFGGAAAEAVHLPTGRIAHHGEAGDADGCGLCVVELRDGTRVRACDTVVALGMEVSSETPALRALRRERLRFLLAEHPTACLTCPQRTSCPRDGCALGAPEAELCCSDAARCELHAVAVYVGFDGDTVHRRRPPAPHELTVTPLFALDPSLCVGCARCVRACAEDGQSALGWVVDEGGRRRVGWLAPTPAQAGCRYCGSCVEVCPTGARRDPNLPRIKGRPHVPCRTSCPAGVDVPLALWHAAQGDWLAAARVVAERAPLVGVLGDICQHPCESACRRSLLNHAPMSIREVHRVAAAHDALSWATEERRRPSKHAARVAVVGGGPAGIVTSFLLARRGHDVTLLEASEVLGGMLTQVIPTFRLGQEMVHREAAALLTHVRVKLGVQVGPGGVPFEALREQHDAIVLATGCPVDRALGVAGEELAGVEHAVAFLRGVRRGALAPDAYRGKTVAVLGSGELASDAARGALRLGAREVDWVLLNGPWGDLLNHGMRAALREGVRLHRGWRVVRVEGAERVAGVFLDVDRADDEAREAPLARKLVRASVVIVAAGRRSAASQFPAARRGVFFAGDLASGPRTVADAMASARNVAEAVDRHVGGRVARTTIPPAGAVRSYAPERRGFARLLRHDAETEIEPRLLDPATRRPMLTAADAQAEASRCLQCDLRGRFRPPPFPPDPHRRWKLAESSLDRVPSQGGVVRFFDHAGDLLDVVGSVDMWTVVLARLSDPLVSMFDFEPCADFASRRDALLELDRQARQRKHRSEEAT